MNNIKQIIVVRKDLRNKDGHKLRTGKIGAQIAHASMKVFFDRKLESSKSPMQKEYMVIPMTKPMEVWTYGIFKKIVVSVNSEDELMETYNKALEAGIPSALIQDMGLTEFEGPTYTCCGIGPDESEKIDPITGNLPLY